MRDSRAEIIARARAIRAEIDQIFADAEHWNRVQRMADGIDRMLFAEEATRTAPDNVYLLHPPSTAAASGDDNPPAQDGRIDMRPPRLADGPDH